jgi:hypothetical protein
VYKVFLTGFIWIEREPWVVTPDTTIPSDYHTGYPRPYPTGYPIVYPLDTTLHPNSHATLPYLTIIWMRNE